MALDTRGAMHGFAQGFGMMDQHYNNQHRQQMDREMLGLRQEEAEWSREARGRQRQQWQQEDTERDLTGLFQKAQTHGWESLNEHDLSTVQRIYQQNPQSLPPELQQWVRTAEARNQHLGGAAEEAVGLTKQVSGAQARQTHQYKQTAERVRKLTPENSEFMLSKLLTGSGDLTPEEIEALDEAPAGLMMMGTPEMDAALQSVDEQMTIISSGENIHVTPQFLEAVNLIYTNQIGEGKRIVDIFPGKRSGTVVFELEVDGEDGPYRAPMTANRGTEADDDNEVKQVPIEDLIDSLQGAKALHMAFKADPEAQQRLQRFGQMRGYLPQAEEREQWITQQDSHGRVTRINTRTGRAESVHGHLPADHLGLGGGSGSARQNREMGGISSWANHRAMLARGQDEMGNLIDPDMAEKQIAEIDRAYAMSEFGVPEPQLLFKTQQLLTRQPDISADEAKQLVLEAYEEAQQQKAFAQNFADPAAAGQQYGLIGLSQQRQPATGITARQAWDAPAAVGRAIRPQSSQQVQQQLAERLSKGYL